MCLCVRAHRIGGRGNLMWVQGNVRGRGNSEDRREGNLGCTGCVALAKEKVQLPDAQDLLNQGVGGRVGSESGCRWKRKCGGNVGDAEKGKLQCACSVECREFRRQRGKVCV